eukprot:4287665-Alexandrium_andersonii.AAC.1
MAAALLGAGPADNGRLVGARPAAGVRGRVTRRPACRQRPIPAAAGRGPTGRTAVALSRGGAAMRAASRRVRAPSV